MRHNKLMLKSQKGFSAFEGLLLLLLLGILTYACRYVYSANSEKANTSSVGQAEKTAEPAAKKLVVVGDIVCDPDTAKKDTNNCQSDETFALAKDTGPDAVVAVGDLQYENGSLDDYQSGFDKSWGGLKSIIYPTPGNHEYHTTGASGYFDYFKADPHPKVDISQGYYSFNLGAWHIISLNSNCKDIGGCDEASAQIKWLEADLNANQNKCSLAFWHHPRFTSGKYFNDADTKDRSKIMWEKLVAAKADVVLNGHDHLYERFAAQTTDGVATETGLQQFTVGTGGKILYAKTAVAANSEKAVDDHFGILKMELLPSSYQWQFIATSSQVLDAGQRNCN